jgi:hypothetical protein
MLRRFRGLESTRLLPVAERHRPDDDDLEFDFFDEPLTTEVREEVEAPPRRPGGGPPPVEPRAPGRNPQILRLAALIGGAIAIAIALVFGINACRGGETSEYDEYMESVSAVASQSSNVGVQLGELLTTTGLTLDELQTGLAGLAEQQAQVVERAQQLTPPSPLLEEQESLVEAMQLRESGLRGLEQAVAQLQPASDPGEAGTTLAEQSSRVLAGTVVYEDLFKARAEEVLRQEGISGVAVPESPFLPEPDLLDASSLSSLVERITQGGGGGGAATGLHGNGIVSTTVLPEGRQLSPDEENTVEVTEDFAIVVAVENSGDFQETNVQVTIRILQADEIKKSKKISVIESGETQEVTFENFTNIAFTALTTLKVTVRPVDGEQNTDNNTVDYPVIFTIA